MKIIYLWLLHFVVSVKLMITELRFQNKKRGNFNFDFFSVTAHEDSVEVPDPDQTVKITKDLGLASHQNPD